MARKPRLIGQGLYHHIYAWGNDRHPIFRADLHYKKYLRFLELFSKRYDIDVIAYALLEVHIHLFLCDLLGKLSLFMEELHGNYGQFYNKICKRVGHVFGERFNNKIVQPNNYGLWLSRYIHRQAVEAGIVNDPKDYPWTSYRVYIGLELKRFLKPEVILQQFGDTPEVYSLYEKFTIGEDDGPINWRKSSQIIVGDNDFLKKVKPMIDNKKVASSIPEDLVNFASTILTISPNTLLNPRGRIERQIRRQAFKLLADKYGYSATKIAKSFKVTPWTVLKGIKDD